MKINAKFVNQEFIKKEVTTVNPVLIKKVMNI